MIKTFTELQEIMLQAIHSNKLFIREKQYWEYIGRITTPDKYSIYIYIDNDLAYIKVGDGGAYLIDLPIVYSNSKQYILTVVDELKEIE